ncbi:MAG: SDR family oxidoreductase [Abitibacteriaceae bacterium]|nr:SDR family oxidoreductase [Abditibacteriaceae bacterium]MBV9866583.1 SDR family oxidoreductase [Abditibacteriaceae bacterium]
MTTPQKVYFITGSTGIAAATSKLAAQAGVQVFITSRTESNCRALADEITALGGICAYHVAELTDEAAVREAVPHCVSRFGRIDALFNVAGISGRRFGDGPIHECTEAGWDITLDTNAKSMFFMCREVIQQMMEQPISDNGLRGTVLNMASVLGFSPQRKFFATHAYAASKGAIIGMSKSMAAYYAPHKIRVNVIAPSLIRTPMSQRAQENPEILEFMKEKQPLVEDLIDAEDVARAALFLLSDESRVITGDVLTVDAGWTVSG